MSVIPVIYLFIIFIKVSSCSKKFSFCRFDKRITAFAEDKFGRDGIDVKLGSMVVKVTDKDICTKVRGNGEITSMPYGMVVWSTGIGPLPIIKDFMKQVGQVCKFRSINLILCC